MITRYSLRFFLIITSLLVLSCGSESVEELTIKKEKISLGDWRIVFDIGKEKLPMNLSILDNGGESLKVVFRNAEEKIIAENVMVKGDSIMIEMPLFSSQFFLNIIDPNHLSGYWVNYNKSKDYKIPVAGVFNEKFRFTNSESVQKMPSDKWEVSFSPNQEDDMYKALGLFKSIDNNVVCGTFLTETGDYRFLEGNLIDNKLKLSCFDGAHLFMFTANLKGDSLVNGMFYSGNHYDEPWEAVVNDQFELRDPEILTQVVGETNWQDVMVKNVQGELLKIGDLASKDKVNIIQIMGTWCPNCIDETLYYKELLSKQMDLNIIPVCFEKEATAIDAMNKLKARLELPYELYLGGKLSKKVALELFPMLSNVSSFPTSIIIDKKGVIRKVHTGFYGPGTGEYYTSYKRDMTAFISALVNEPN